MAKKAGVSVATISRAMNEETRKKVSQETLIKIDRLVERCKYTPSLAAKNLRKTSTKTIGVVFPYVNNIFYSSYYTNILSGVANYLIGTEYQFKLILLKVTDAPGVFPSNPIACEEVPDNDAKPEISL